MHAPKPLPRLRALLLDFGGTLASEVPSRGAIYAEAARGAGLDVSERVMAACMGAAHDALPIELADGSFRYTRPWFEAFIEHVFVEQLGLGRGRLEGVKEELFARFSDAATFQLFPGARELVDAARARGLRTAIVSNWSEPLPQLVESLGLGPFDLILASAAERLEKPDSALFERALSRLGVEPAEALHVGDSHRNDVLGAEALGISALLLDRGADGPTRDRTPRVVRSLDEVGELLTSAG